MSRTGSESEMPDDTHVLLTLSVPIATWMAILDFATIMGMVHEREGLDEGEAAIGVIQDGLRTLEWTLAHQSKGHTVLALDPVQPHGPVECLAQMVPDDQLLAGQALLWSNPGQRNKSGVAAGVNREPVARTWCWDDVQQRWVPESPAGAPKG